MNMYNRNKIKSFKNYLNSTKIIKFCFKSVEQLNICHLLKKKKKKDCEIEVVRQNKAAKRQKLLF